eukprot:CAMPEP_0119331006 /NCGR_PEP_ID=MMETSP1333-20130426/79539_1 /TAXON_ID=418940 /ORGANISM="Scyphosphaera apsteinii, Strain RCC1455" /LENGTH=135 /DNA_ID=CAMNT_0007340503 /DNA_START=47 /DNA_END=451 /DNA_ORIENTATION=+
MLSQQNFTGNCILKEEHHETKTRDTNCDKEPIIKREEGNSSMAGQPVHRGAGIGQVLKEGRMGQDGGAKLKKPNHALLHKKNRQGEHGDCVTANEEVDGQEGQTTGSEHGDIERSPEVQVHTGPAETVSKESILD